MAPFTGWWVAAVSQIAGQADKTNCTYTRGDRNGPRDACNGKMSRSPDREASPRRRRLPWREKWAFPLLCPSPSLSLQLSWPLVAMSALCRIQSQNDFIPRETSTASASFLAGKAH